MQYRFFKRTLQCFLYAVALGFATNSVGADEIAPTLEHIIKKWQVDSCYKADIRYSVSMPQMSDEVTYSITLRARATGLTDQLSPSSYLIDWTLSTSRKDIKGFSAYFDGNHYRYTDGGRLQEYHYVEDSVPFVVGSGGVQRNAQFVELIPQMMADQLLMRSDDPEYSFSVTPDTIVGSRKAIAMHYFRIISGTVVQEAEYILDCSTLMPVAIHMENNPGTIGEQTVNVVYVNSSATSDSCPPADENELITAYPDIFANHRNSNFRLMNLVGSPLPGFSHPTVTGNRYTHEKGDRFRAPLILMIFDPEKGFAKDMAADLRRAGAQLHYAPAIIFAAVTSNIDMIEDTIGPEELGESHLMTAFGLARDCGVTETPVIILADRDGIVRHILLGYNKNIRESVIEKMSVMAP